MHSYDFDLPEVFKENDRSHFIAGSVLGSDWMQAFSKLDGSCFLDFQLGDLEERMLAIPLMRDGIIDKIVID